MSKKPRKTIDPLSVTLSGGLVSEIYEGGACGCMDTDPVTFAATVYEPEDGNEACVALTLTAHNVTNVHGRPENDVEVLAFATEQELQAIEAVCRAARKALRAAQGLPDDTLVIKLV